MAKRATKTARTDTAAKTGATPGSTPGAPLSPEEAELNAELLAREIVDAVSAFGAHSALGDDGDMVQMADSIGRAAINKLNRGFASAAGGVGDAFLDTYDLSDDARLHLVRQSRAAFTINGLARQIVNLWCAFTVGGHVAPALGRWDASKPRGETLGSNALWKFWSSPENSRVLSHGGVQRSAIRAALDGELFFVVKDSRGEPGATGGARRTPRVRQIPALRVLRIVSSPDDADEVSWYLVKSGDARFLFPDWTRKFDAALPARPVPAPGDPFKLDLERAVVVPDQWVMHFPLKTGGERGNGILSPSLPWIGAIRDFMANRIGVQHALHKFALKTISKGGSEASMTAIKSLLQSSLAASGGGTGAETNPPPAPGGVFMGRGVDIAPMSNFETGASAAEIDGTMLVERAASGSGFPPHYIGNASSYRLATATSLEMPIRVMLDNDQNYWRWVYSTVCAFAVHLLTGKAWDKIEVYVKFPSLNQKTLPAFITALTNLFSTAPYAAEDGEIWSNLLKDLDVEDVETAAAAMVAKATEANARNARNADAAVAAKAAGAGGDGGGDDDGGDDGDDDGDVLKSAY
jgi:hypothetical protein